MSADTETMANKSEPHVVVAANLLYQAPDLEGDPVSPYTLDTTPNQMDDNATAISSIDNPSTIHTQKTFSTTDGIDILGPPPPDTFQEWNKSWSGRIVHNRKFKRARVALILLTLLLLAIDTTSWNAWLILQAIRLMFTAEVVLQLVHLGPARFVRDGWMVYDSVVLGLVWIPSVGMVFLSLRTLRLVRTLRLASKFKSVRQVALGILYSLSKLVAVWIFLAAFVLVAALVGMHLFASFYDQDDQYNYFSRLDVAAWTVVQIMTMDQWTTIVNPIVQVHPWASLVFGSMILWWWVFVSLMVAVVVDAFAVIRSDPMNGILLRKASSASPPRPRNEPDSNLAEAVDLVRLERKLDNLTEITHSLMHTQVMMQELIRMQQSGSTAPTSTVDF